MFRGFLSSVIILLFPLRLLSQVIVNEIILKSDSIISVEINNYSSTMIYLSSASIHFDSVTIIDTLQDYGIHPSDFVLIDFKSSQPINELRNVSIQLFTDNDQFHTQFNGCILKGESAGRSPDLLGDFIIYDSAQVSPGFFNMPSGRLVKKTSKTKFTPRDSSPNAALIYNNEYWIFGGWDYNAETGIWSSKANVWKSPDGLNWTLVNAKPPYSPYSNYIVFNNKMNDLHRGYGFHEC